MLTPALFQKDALKTMKHRPKGWRKGQFLFYYLDECHPTLAEEIRGGSSDPFYQDENIPAFWNMVFNNWQI